MPAKKARTYGKKKAATASSSLFGASSSPIPGEKVVKKREEEEVAAFFSQEEGHTTTTTAAAITTEEVVEGLSLLNLGEGEDLVDPDLTPLVELFESKNLDFRCATWQSILPEECSVVKIAEASYAEVYRVTTQEGTSIVKIMPLVVPHDPSSSSRINSSKVDDVIPELQIMDVLTEIPGFVKFKAAWIVKGQHSAKFVKAWENWTTETNEISEFLHPGTYSDNATFLAIELGDAGEVLENVVVDTWPKFWDIFTGVVTALAIAEENLHFEHRDLHENNICVYTKASSQDPTLTVGPGSSGMLVTLIDYGLSRINLSDDEVAFKDLETDLEIFQGEKGHRQFETYRCMRSFLYSGTKKKMPMKFHKESTTMSEADKTWEEHMPYSNVLWISYIFNYLYTQLHESLPSPDPEATAASVPIPAATPALRTSARHARKASTISTTPSLTASTKSTPSIKSTNKSTSSLPAALPAPKSIPNIKTDNENEDKENENETSKKMKECTEKLKKKLDPVTLGKKGAFESAAEVYKFVVDEGGFVGWSGGW